MDPADRIQGQASISTNIVENTDMTGSITRKKGINWDAFTKFKRALGKFPSSVHDEKAIQDVIDIFLSAEMDIENSSNTANVPVAANVLLCMMSDMELWALTLFHIVHLVRSDHVPPLMYQRMKSNDKTMKEIFMINADFQLPTPLVQTRNFSFYRFIKEVNSDTWVIFDISTECFLLSSDNSVEQNLWRRLSGVMVRRSTNGTKVVWVENIQAPPFALPNTMYYRPMRTNMAFTAQHWLSTLLWWFERSRSSFTSNMMNVNAQNLLPVLSGKMKKIFLDSVGATPDDRNWVILRNEECFRVMRRRIDTVNSSGTNFYFSVKSFRLETSPSGACEFLQKKLLDMTSEWARAVLLGKVEEMIQYRSDSNEISLLKRGTHEDVVSDNLNDHKYILRETSRDGVCSFVVGASLTTQNVHSSLYFGVDSDVILRPYGFTILPDGLNSNSSLVTLVVCHPVNILKNETEKNVIDPMRLVTDCIIQDLRNEYADLMSETVDDCSQTTCVL